MNEFQAALLIGSIITAAVAWRVPRALLWILAGAASFVASVAWARYSLPMPPLFTACCDAAACLTIYAYARKEWELKLFALFRASVFVSLIYFCAAFVWPKAASHWLYVTILEAINWTALLLILGTWASQRIGSHVGDRPSGAWARAVGWARASLLATRPAHRFWHS